MATRRRSRSHYLSLNNVAGAKASSISRPLQYTTFTVRSLRLQTIQQLTAWRQIGERKKTAIYDNRRTVVLHSLIHFIPLGASIALISMTLRSTLASHEASNASTALQFAAKLLDVFIQASIASVVLAFVRAFAISPEPVPFGGLLGSFRITDVSYLWSLDFWGLISSSSSSFHGLRKALLILILLLSVSLAALVGPSCAVLMIPRLIDRDGANGLFLLNRSSEVYPTSIGMSTIDVRYVTLP